MTDLVYLEKILNLSITTLVIYLRSITLYIQSTSRIILILLIILLYVRFIIIVFCAISEFIITSYSYIMYLVTSQTILRIKMSFFGLICAFIVCFLHFCYVLSKIMIFCAFSFYFLCNLRIFIYPNNLSCSTLSM